MQRLLFSIDVHNEGIHGYFTKAKFENLHASRYIIDFLKKELSDFMNYRIDDGYGGTIWGLSAAAPDVGSAKRAKHYSKKLGCGLIVGAKFRDETKDNKDSADKIIILGDVNRRNLITIDDMIDTAGTIVLVSRGLKDVGANEIYLVCTLPIFSGPAIERLTKLYNEGVIKGVIGTDVVTHLTKPEWYHEVSVAPLFGDVIYRIENNMSVSEEFD